MASIRSFIKQVGQAIWFRPNRVRRSMMGPYAGLRFEVSPQLIRKGLGVYYREYEAPVTLQLKRLVRPGMTVFDVGAHVGIHALYIGKLLGGGGRVYAFEPWPDNFRRLQRNVDINPTLEGVVIPVAKAVGASSGYVNLSLGETDGAHHFTRPSEAATLKAVAITVDDFVQTVGRAPSIILVDVEGAELEVLRGAEQVLRRTKPCLILEHHGDERQAKMTAWLAERGYLAERLGSRHILAGPRA